MRVDEQTTDMRRQCADERTTYREVRIHQGWAKRRSDDCAWKAAEITPGDLSCVVATRLREPKGDLTAGQKSAEGI